ncbi:uncharacterized protein BDCG_02299 [Blastomyces dermatitidis ER-3]|uniref:Uncharacterized protein n=2 Tax=Ajellomyces dermatitidis TaxID=5039 RepID=F2TLP9_AJEDA|nr:uncharacterized protein BDCG_02299 [Blastomyces dermatitidis ER-3]EEQ87179.1 hypothetical protein BDCG_02299 [Blastomyces dermatitidis ER-3]EGE84162.1 hypothetical protein BDDG_07107 [Blastomyces dermatitidis ATCC 18188]
MLQMAEFSLHLNNQFPTLRFSIGQLRGLHGRHRAQVGSELLPPIDRWWMVDLYLDDVGDELKITLLEYEGEQNEPFRQRWLTRLSKCNRERLEQLDNHRNRRLRQGFDALLAVSGLWGRGMRISMIHRLIAVGCIEEILNSLSDIGEYWSSLVDYSPAAMTKISSDTVEELQLMAPHTSRIEAKAARGYVLSGQAFVGFSESERKTIWSRMEKFDGLIPSVYTFFENFKYLESCAHCVKRLFGPSRESIWNTMKHMFITALNTEEDCLIQTSESTFRQTRMMSAERLNLAYRQVWLYAMRHYLLMPADPKNDDDLLAKPNRAKADERVVYEMAKLAHRLGFHSPEITALMNQSPDQQIARAALLRVRIQGYQVG